MKSLFYFVPYEGDFFCLLTIEYVYRKKWKSFRLSCDSCHRTCDQHGPRQELKEHEIATRNCGGTWINMHAFSCFNCLFSPFIMLFLSFSFSRCPPPPPIFPIFSRFLYYFILQCWRLCGEQFGAVCMQCEGVSSYAMKKNDFSLLPKCLAAISKENCV